MEDYEYNIPETEKVLIDPSTNSIIDKKTLSPWEFIKLAAKFTEQEIKEPNKSCKKCYGRGYVSIRSETKEPIPCDCIFNITKEDKMRSDILINNSRKLNREEKRRLEKMNRKGR